MREVVHRGATGVHVNLPGFEGYQRLDLIGEGIVDLDFVHRVSAGPFGAGNKQPIVAEPPEPRNDAGPQCAVGSTGNGLLVPRR